MGIIILFMFGIYIMVSYGVAKIAYSIVEKERVFLLVFVGMLTFPFWDLMLQGVIKGYYETTGALEPKVYAYPEKDKDGRIESLSLAGILHVGKESLHENGIYNLSENIGYKKFKNHVEKSLHLSVYESNKKWEDFKIIKINLQKKRYNYTNKIDARFVFKSRKQNYFNLYEIDTYSLVDTKKDLVLGEYRKVRFLKYYATLRTEWLGFMTGNGRPMHYVSSPRSKGSSFDKLFSKLEIGEDSK